MAKQVSKKHLQGAWIVIRHYIQTHRSTITAIALFSILSAVGNAFIPLIVGKILDAMIDVGAHSSATDTIYQLLFVWLVIQLAVAFVSWRTSIASTDLAVSIRTQYMAERFSKILTLPLSFHKKKKSGQIGDQINRASNALETIAGNLSLEIVPQVLALFVALIIAATIHLGLAALLLAGVSIYGIVLFVKVRPLAGLSRIVHKKWSRAFGDAYDSVYNVAAVKQLHTESYEAKRRSEDFEGKAKKAWMNIIHVWRSLDFYQRVTIILTQLCVFVISVGLVGRGELTIGELVAFNSYANLLFGPFIRLGSMWQTLQNGIVDIAETEKTLSTRPEVYNPSGSSRLRTIRGDVEFDSVSFGYEKHSMVLSDISLSVGAGTRVALVGESGVGKTTFVDLIPRFLVPTSGTITIDGEDTGCVPLKDLREAIAIVPQEPVLLNSTIKKNLTYGNFAATQEQIENAARMASALDFIEKFPKGWKQQVGERGIQLSVGQKQRVSIARAFLRDPSILILDEPTSALDAVSEAHIQESLHRLMAGRTTFIIAHRLSTIKEADLILVLEKGTIKERGTFEELMQKGGSFKELYDLQVGHRPDPDQWVEPTGPSVH